MVPKKGKRIQQKFNNGTRKRGDSPAVHWGSLPLVFCPPFCHLPFAAGLFAAHISLWVFCHLFKCYLALTFLLHASCHRLYPTISHTSDAATCYTKQPSDDCAVRCSPYACVHTLRFFHPPYSQYSPRCRDL
ncbi:hypothetical protein H4582DRAFT_1960017 [Lactarius indigo]|nr:hypothetical protein H4582DRAFT_1960017 [Lactarius indigo]